MRRQDGEAIKIIGEPVANHIYCVSKNRTENVLSKAMSRIYHLTCITEKRTNYHCRITKNLICKHRSAVEIFTIQPMYSQNPIAEIWVPSVL